MPQIVPNPFTRIEFTPEEEKQASTFSDLNKMYLMSLRASFAELKLALAFDPEKPQKFLQEEANLAGKIVLLNQLIGD